MRGGISLRAAQYLPRNCEEEIFLEKKKKTSFHIDPPLTQVPKSLYFISGSEYAIKFRLFLGNLGIFVITGEA